MFLRRLLPTLNSVKSIRTAASFVDKLSHHPVIDVDPLETYQSKLNYYKGSSANGKLRLSEDSLGALYPRVAMDNCKYLLFDEVNVYGNNGYNAPLFLDCSKLMFHNCDYDFEIKMLESSNWRVCGLDTIYTNTEYLDNNGVKALLNMHSVKQIFVNNENTYRMLMNYIKKSKDQYDVDICQISNIEWANAYNSLFIPCIQFEPSLNKLLQKIIDTQFALKQSIRG